MFVIGPLVAAAGVALSGPGATLVATAVLMLAGGLAFASQAAVEPGATLRWLANLCIVMSRD
jgi:hypothetical protein